MKKLLLALLFIAPCARAQSYGCYIELASNFCSNREILCSLGEFDNTARYGVSIGRICDYYAATYNGYLECASDRDIALNGWQETIDIGRRYEATMRRLRRACGLKCKRIK